MPTQTRYRSSDVCTRAGCYRFDGYIDGSLGPLPQEHEATTQLAVGERFPRIRSAHKMCWWVPAEDDRVPDDEIERLEWGELRQGGPTAGPFLPGGAAG